MKFIYLKPNLWNRWFGKWKSIRIDNDGLNYFGHENEHKYYFKDFDTFPEIKNNFFSISIIIYLDDKKLNTIVINGISKKYYEKECSLIEKNYKVYFLKKFRDFIKEIDLKVYKSYIKDSWITPLNKKINWILKNYKLHHEKYLNDLNQEEINLIISLKNLSPISQNKKVIRTNFEETQLKKYSSFFSNVENQPLTENQKLASVRENDFNLILAAAGTGKTSAMVAKAAYLVQSGIAKPEEILLLAFAKEASEELGNRIKKAGEKIHKNYNQIKASTFHSLGSKIIAKCDGNSDVSKLATDKKKYYEFIQNTLEVYLRSTPEALSDFMDLIYVPLNPFDFKTSIEYENHTRDNDYRCLSDDLMRGYQEVKIGNFLFLNQIKFEYERGYEVNGKRYKFESGRVYKPDFYLTDFNIYIEHFGIDKMGNVKPGINKAEYNKHINDKRNLHEKNYTNLIETFHHEWKDNKLLSSLEEKFKEYNKNLTRPYRPEKEIILKPLTNEELLEKLSGTNFISEFAVIIANSIMAIKESKFDINEIQKRLNDLKNFNTNQFIKFLNFLSKKYEEELNKNEQIDFHDMIHEATNLIDKGKFKPSWSFILVDEYQDISNSRNNLLKSLINATPNASLTVVGDDWQSIYRFTGAKLDLITRFEKQFGENTETILDISFRYNDSIAKVAGKFIMMNVEQNKKIISTIKPSEKTKVFILNSNKLEAVITKIVEKSKNKDIKIMILGRDNWVWEDSEKNLIEQEYPYIEKLIFTTIHSAKGLEADHTIILGCDQGSGGLPSDKKNKQAVEALLPKLDDYPYTEERRLMYVALTRSKGNCYLLIDPLAPSVFIDELIFGDYEIEKSEISLEPKYKEIFACRNCESGRMRRKPKGNYYLCSNWTICKTSSQECKVCQAPMHENDLEKICNNPDCGNKISLCPDCYRPLILRPGPFGKFWACTGFNRKASNPCRYTTKKRPDGFINDESVNKKESILDLIGIK